MAVRQPNVPSSPDSGRITVPKLNLDPVQSLHPWPVVVTCCNRDLTIPALSAAEWLSVLMVDQLQLDDVFPGLLDSLDQDWIEDQFILGRLGIGEVRDLILGIIETASARRWWITLRLVDYAKSSWDVLGPEMMLRGVNTTIISLSAWLDILLITILRNLDTKDVTMFTLKLEAPPPEEQDAQELEMDASSFLAMGAE